MSYRVINTGKNKNGSGQITNPELNPGQLIESPADVGGGKRHDKSKDHHRQGRADPVDHRQYQHRLLPQGQRQ